MKTIILIPLLSAVCIAASAQDPVKMSPQYYKVLLENDQVLVFIKGLLTEEAICLMKKLISF